MSIRLFGALISSAALGLGGCSLASLRPPAEESAWKFPLAVDGRLSVDGEITGSLQEAGKELVLLATRSGRVYAVDAAKRTLRWSYSAPVPIDGSPLAVGERLVVVDRTGRMFGLDLEGKVVWKNEPGRPVAPAPAGFSGLVVFGSERTKVVAVEPRTGKGKWTLDASSAVRSSLIPWRGGLVFGTADGKIHLVGPEGKPLASRDAGGVLVGPALVAGDILVSGLEDHSIAGWNLPSLKRRWSVRLGGIFSGPPAFDGRRIFAVLSNHVLFCLSVKTGTTLWWHPLPGRGLYAPVLAGTHIFAASPTTSLVACPRLGGDRVVAFQTPRDIRAGPHWLDARLWIAYFEPEADRTTILFLKSPAPAAKEKTS